MPKTAAAVLGFALVTGSIGLNTVRYPVVWKMVGPAEPSMPTGETPRSAVAPAAPAPSPSASEPSTPVALQKPPESPPALPAMELSSEKEPQQGGAPGPDTADKPEAAPSSSTAPALPSQPAAALDDGQASSGEELRKPLVPVLPISVAKDVANGADLAAGVCRLPPVDRNGLSPNQYDTSRLFSGTIPDYPRTKTP
jgi:hypothetical protein